MAVAIIAALGLLSPTAAGAATLVPTTTADEFGTGAGCSLREAIQAAQTDGAFDNCVVADDDDADTIVLQSGQTYALTLAGAENANATGDLDIVGQMNDRTLTIQTSGAARATIDANGDGVDDPVAATGDRAIDVAAASTQINSMTINNLAITDGSGSAGGGITANLTTILMTITGSRIFANHPTGGIGGVRLDGDNASVTDTEITNNTATVIGGISGIGDMTITGSTISGNSATSSRSGGLEVADPSSVDLINTTLSGNSAATDGGGAYVDGDLDVFSVTIAGNTATNDGGGVHFGGHGSFSAHNSILGDNIDLSSGTHAPDCFGLIENQGYNLVEDHNSATCQMDLPNNDVTGDPVLGVLAPNGGPTETHALLAGSPAIDAGDPETPGSLNACPATDQRGLLRGAGAGRCDIGAFEVQPVPSVIPPSHPAAPQAKKKKKKCKQAKKRSASTAKKKCKRKKK